jgi:[protein-PII] uridylyltransferase
MATEAVFRGGRASDLSIEHVERVQEVLARGARRRLVGARPQDPALSRWADSMEDAYFIAFSSKTQLAHFLLAERAAGPAGAAASSELLYDGHAAEVVIAAQDRRGLFADLCGAMARLGANIVGARVYTSSSGGALDIFYVQDTAGQPYGRDDERAMDKLLAALELAAQGCETAVQGRRLNYARTAAFAVPPSVALDNDASDLATVVEVSGRDRPGLLQSLARTLADAGLSVQSAHVENYGERAVDAFYVLDEDGAKLDRPDRIAALKTALTAALLEAEPEVQRARDRIIARSASVRESAL